MSIPHALRPDRLGIGLAVGVLTLAGCSSDPAAHHLGDVVETTFYSLLEGTEQGPGTVAVTGVRDGTFDELTANGFELDADDVDPATTDVLYVDTRFTNTGDVAVDLREPSGLDGDTLVPSLTVIDGGAEIFGPCPALPDTLAAGDTVAGCSIVLVPDGVDVDRISYLPDASEDFVYWEV